LGNRGRELYLECLQTLLRKQVVWLISQKSLPPDLEVLVRDLWDLRIRGFSGLTAAKDEGKVDSESQSSSQMTYFSSQSEHELSSNDGSAPGSSSSSTKIKDWSSERWALPKIVDTLALIYLGCLALGEPVRVGDIYRWAKTNQMPYLDAVSPHKRASYQVPPNTDIR
jgi:RNA polymerase I-specific transcription initiation factor RRN7